MNLLKRLSLFLIAIIFFSCNSPVVKNQIKVSTNAEVLSALKNAQAGDVITLLNGVYNDLEIKFRGQGTKENPIVLKAETPGKVLIQGKSFLKFGGQFLIADGLYFKNGYSPSNAVVDFRINKDEIANNCVFTNSVIIDFNKPRRDKSDLWVQFWGRNNELSNCYIAGKTNRGPTVRVSIEGIESINNHHKIISNHFGPRPVKGGPSGETIQLGNSYTSMSPSYTLIERNLFEECNGEVEVISSKTNFNIFRNNVFYKSEGSLVTRHGNYCTIDGNYFIGDGINENYGGIRIINTGHWVTNNYFFNLKGKSFRSPLAVMNGIPKSPLNRYNQVTDVVVAFNTYINCSSPWQFGVGQNLDQKEVLPKSEIRSARAIRTTVANNIIYNENALENIVVENDKADGVLFKNNIVDNQGGVFKDFNGGITELSLELNKISDDILVPSGISEDVEVFKGFDFNTIEKDIFGTSRRDINAIGAFIGVDVTNPNILDKSKYGTTWFSNEVETKAPSVIVVTNNENLQSKIDEAENGDIIILSSGKHTIKKSLIINKKLTIKSEDKTKMELFYSGDSKTPLFSLQPYGKLTLKNVAVKGNTLNYAFASLERNMSNHFGLTVFNSKISDFDYVLKVYKESFAERITFENTSISNCTNGIELSEEINDRGDYNTEYLVITNCTFNNVKQNVIDYYRGGYDESTIGGNLLITNSNFTNCGAEEKNNILLNHRGIINVNINNNTFTNNDVNLISLLWGAKNNKASNNTAQNSGKIKTEQNLKLTLMY